MKRFLRMMPPLSLACVVPFFAACNQTTQPSGKIDEGGHTDGHQTPDSLATSWVATPLITLTEDGLLQANVQTALTEDQLHVFYYDVHTASSPDDTARYDLKYLQWDLTLNQQVAAPEIVVSLDNSRSLSAALGVAPQVAYQGGNIRECQGSEQSDAMVSHKLTTWTEETAAIGFVERTAPILEDGFAGGTVSLAVDQNNHRHLAFQFFYEGCDQNPFAYPDLHYVSLLSGVDYQNPDNAPEEEQVDGNVLATDDSANYNKLVGTGDVNKLLLDANDNPVVFYSAEDPDLVNNKVGLKIARRENDAWTSEWLVDDCLVEGLDAAYTPNGQLAVALYTTHCTGTELFDPQLHYLEQTQTGWQMQTIAMSARAGQYPALAFTAEHQPLIAFYEIATSQNHPRKNLKMTLRTEAGWVISEVSNLTDVGQYNRLHVLPNGEPVVVSYVASQRQISVFRPEQ